MVESSEGTNVNVLPRNVLAEVVKLKSVKVWMLLSINYQAVQSSNDSKAMIHGAAGSLAW